MSDGNVHFMGNVAMGGAITLLAWAVAPDQDLWQPVLAGAIVGALVTPDADQEVKTFPEHLLLDIPLIGKYVGAIFIGYWMPYAVWCKHRGTSHMLFLGTLTRVAWSLVCILTMVFFAVGVAWKFGDPQATWDSLAGFVFKPRSFGFYFAWWLQDWSHLMLDGIPLGMRFAERRGHI